METSTKYIDRKGLAEGNHQLDRIPPQAIECEVAVLAAILIEESAIHQVVNFLNEESFYLKKHQFIYRAIMKLYSNNDAIDIITVSEKLKSDGALIESGDRLYLAQLCNSIGSAAHVETHAKEVMQQYLRRKLITIETKSIAGLYDYTNDVFDLMEGVLTEVEKVYSEINKIQQLAFADILIKRVEELKKAGISNSGITGLSCGLFALDHQTNGFQPSDFIILAARPSMGKTALAISFALWQVKNYIPVGFFSLEMQAAQIVERILATESEINMKKVRRGMLDAEQWKQIDSVTARALQYPFYICDKGGMSINDIVATAKTWKVKYNIQAIYIDYLQLITVKDKRYGSREQEVSETSRRLKQLAKELNIPVIALAQLNRGVEARTDKRPLLSDLRESGSIEMDADLVIFPFREDYYNDNEENKGACELIIAKYRNGATGTVMCRFKAETQAFYDYN